MTLIEVIVAMLMLSVGILAFVGTNAAVIRMLSRGNRSMKAAFYSQERLETLRATPCQLLADGTSTRLGVYQMSWTVSDAPGGMSKRVKMINAYPASLSTTRADTMEISVLCIR
jgi:Tfp pilus assembly protein PilV